MGEIWGSNPLILPPSPITVSQTNLSRSLPHASARLGAEKKPLALAIFSSEQRPAWSLVILNCHLNKICSSPVCLIFSQEKMRRNVLVMHCLFKTQLVIWGRPL